LRLKKSSRAEFRGKISVTDMGLFPHLYLCDAILRVDQGVRPKDEQDERLNG
jgi:hypothetical protein